MRYATGTTLVTAVLLAVGWPSAELAAARFTRGDCNANGNVVGGSNCEISDPIFLLNFLFLGGPAPPCEEACNSNDDARLDLTDAVHQLSYCFRGGPPPPAPFPACGDDPTPSAGCVEFPACPQDDCAPQDARGVGLCALVLGVFWDGERCAFVSGCSCEGEDCDSGYDSIEACEADRAACREAACEPQKARGVGACEALLGYRWDGRVCRPVVGCECEGPDCDRLFASSEECADAVASCPRDCEPMDVTPLGLCDVILGHVWNGAFCEALSGCTSEGEDVHDLYDTEEECLLAAESCRCGPMDARGVGPCRAILGWAWDGRRCRQLSGCSCEGADCEFLFPSGEECTVAHSGCPTPCQAMEVGDFGPCDAVLGYAWNGFRCVTVSGCDCANGCDEFFDTVEECERTFEACR
ncbi:MAG: hypothetical protein O7J95_16570 [Planctomycetota bacterium]|nr:hypothetical protein [Planctomycetota bacterium]